MLSVNIQVLIVLITGVSYALVSRRLTFWAAFTGALVGWLIFKGVGFTGLGMLATFFIAASLATSWQSEKKQKFSTEPQVGGRNTRQVLANGGVPAILGMAAWLNPGSAHLFTLAIAGALASATADTLSSEIGSALGTNFYDILSYKKTGPGPDGVVSIAGFLAGIFGTILIALAYVIGAGFGKGLAWIIIAGMAGNLFDSVLGATLERKGLLSNNMVNFFNTAVGALVCALLAALAG